MKRFLAVFVSLVVATSLLTSCASESLEVSSTLPSEEPAETNSINISNGPIFEFTRTDFVEGLRKAFNSLPDGFDVPNAFESEPSVTESMGCTVYIYKADECTKAIVYTHPRTDEIVRFTIQSNSNNMTEKDAVVFGTYAAFITGVFATEDEIDELDKKLAIADTPYTQNTVHLFTGENAKFAYTITDGVLTVRISPSDD